MVAEYVLRPPVLADERERSYWLSTIYPYACRPAARGRYHYDFVLIGGGLTGLWTALRLRQEEPGATIAVVEADICGSGASGRNGGHVHSWFESLDRLSAVTGTEEAIRLADATVEAMAELAGLQADGTIDMDLRLDGWLWTATAKSQEGAWDRALALGERLAKQRYRRVLGREIAAYGGSEVPYVGVVEPGAGSVNPAKMTCGLRDFALAKGIDVFERSPVRRIAGRQPTRVFTASAEFAATKVLLATNAWAGSVPEINRYMYTVIGSVIATSPIPQRLDAIGWTGGAALCDSQMQVLYYQRTNDGRVIFGRGGGRPVYRDRLGSKVNRDSAALNPLRQQFIRLYPALADAAIDYYWSGPVDCVPSHLPIIDHLAGNPDVYYCVGWNGTALAQIPVVSRIIAAQLAGATGGPWSESGLVGAARRRRIVREPFRYVAARAVHGAVSRVNAGALEQRRANVIDRALVSLIPHPDRGTFD